MVRKQWFPVMPGMKEGTGPWINLPHGPLQLPEGNDEQHNRDTDRNGICNGFCQENSKHLVFKKPGQHIDKRNQQDDLSGEVLLSPRAMKVCWQASWAPKSRAAAI